MWKLFFKSEAIKSFKKITKKDQVRIKNKLEFFCNSENPLVFARKLTNPQIWTYRFRVGEYRIIFDIDETGKIIILLLIWHRKDIYK